jgi:hypothetical protein
MSLIFIITRFTIAQTGPDVIAKSSRRLRLISRFHDTAAAAVIIMNPFSASSLLPTHLINRVALFSPCRTEDADPDR